MYINNTYIHKIMFSSDGGAPCTCVCVAAYVRFLSEPLPISLLVIKGFLYHESLFISGISPILLLTFSFVVSSLLPCFRLVSVILKLLHSVRFRILINGLIKKHHFEASDETSSWSFISSLCVCVCVCGPPITLNNNLQLETSVQEFVVTLHHQASFITSDL